MKAVGNVRVSSEDQTKEGVSLSNQKDKIQLQIKMEEMNGKKNRKFERPAG
jgi:hypothetical protein